MHARRTLVLKHERLSELTTDELGAIAAGAPPTTNTKECPDHTYYCITGPVWCEPDTRTVLCP